MWSLGSVVSISLRLSWTSAKFETQILIGIIGRISYQGPKRRLKLSQSSEGSSASLQGNEETSKQNKVNNVSHFANENLPNMVCRSHVRPKYIFFRFKLKHRRQSGKAKPLQLTYLHARQKVEFTAKFTLFKLAKR